MKPDRPETAAGAQRSAGPRSPRAELADATPHGDVYLQRLIRAQLTLSLRAVVAFAGLVGSLPLLFLLVPELQDVDVLGVPLPIAILVAPIFPAIVLLGLLYQRRANALDEAFRELVDDE